MLVTYELCICAWTNFHCENRPLKGPVTRNSKDRQTMSLQGLGASQVCPILLLLMIMILIIIDFFACTRRAVLSQGLFDSEIGARGCTPRQKAVGRAMSRAQGRALRRAQ